MAAPVKPLDSWAWKSSDGGHAWVVDVGGLVRPITNELSRLAGEGLFFFDTQAHAEDAKAYFGSRALVGVTTADVAGLGALIPGSNPANPPTIAGAVGSVLGLPKLSNTRDLVIRIVKVVVGAALIIIGVNSLLHDQGIDGPAPPKVVPL